MKRDASRRYQKITNHTEHELEVMINFYCFKHRGPPARPGVGSSLVCNMNVSTEEGGARERGPGGGSADWVPGSCIPRRIRAIATVGVRALPARRFMPPPPGCRSWVPGSSSCTHTQNQRNCYLWNQSPTSRAPLSCSRIICPCAALVKMSQRRNQITTTSVHAEMHSVFVYIPKTNIHTTHTFHNTVERVQEPDLPYPALRLQLPAPSCCTTV